MADRNRSYLFIVVTFVVGLLIGWFVFGWLLAPVQWTDALMQDLRLEDQQMFLVTEAEAFALTQDSGKAVERLRQLGSQQHVSEVAGQVVQQAEAAGDIVTADRVRAVVAAVGLTLPEPSAGAPAPAAPQQGGSSVFTVLGLALLVGGLVLVGWLLLRGRSVAPKEQEQPAPEALPDEGAPGGWPGPGAAPASAVPAIVVASPGRSSGTGQEFTAVFHQGDEGYDQSFDIEGADGAYWGECGVNVSEALHGDPLQVTALEVWLFDKGDIRTVTKVLMSDYAYGNQTLREKLSSRGDAVLLAPDLGFVLDAQTLRLMGKIAELEYDDSQTPARSTIRRLRVQLRVMRQAA